MTVFPWISESFDIIQPLLPCSKNEAIAKLVEMMPQRAVDAAMRSVSTSRFRAAKLAIRHMVDSRITLDGDILRERKCIGKQTGHTCLRRLKELLALDESDTGFLKSSAKRYRITLRSLGWIEVIGSLWKWIGPDNAEWSTVTAENRRKKRI